MLDRLIEHLIWADRRTNDALRSLPSPAPSLLRLHAHGLAAAATWVARINGEQSPLPIWPELDLDGCRKLTDQVHASIESLLERLRQPDTPDLVTYTNNQGRTYTNSVADILHHMVLHAMYHRGQVMLGVREQGGEPISTDFIAFSRDR